MGLFSFFRLKGDPLVALQRDPLTRDFTRAAELEFVEKQVGNLRLIGRDADARELITKFLGTLLDFWKDEPLNPGHLSMFTAAALRLDIPEVAKQSLEIVIASQKEPPILDLTTLFLDLGTVYQRLDLSLEKQLDCYQKAVAALPSLNLQYSATRKQKAKAHLCAYLTASRLLLETEAAWHLSRARAFAPEIKFEDTAAVERFFEERRSTLTPDVASRLARLADELQDKAEYVSPPHRDKPASVE